MKVPLLDVTAEIEAARNEVDDAIRRVIDSGKFILGPEVERLEHAVCDYTGARFAIGCASGSDALLLALMAVGAGPGTAVITTPFTFFATAGAVHRLGARTLFVDIEPDTFNMSPSALKHLVEEECKNENGTLLTPTGERVVAVIPVHLFGQCADMDPIMETASKFSLAVIEDAAQSLGARYKGKAAGVIGDIGCYSFFPSKNLGGFGDGGMVVTNDEETAEKIRMLRVHGAKKKYYHSMVGMNSRLDTLQAAVLLVKLPHLDEWADRRAQNAAYYDEAFEGTPIRTPVRKEWAHHVYNQYTLRVPRRDELVEHLKEKNIGCAVYYPLCLHLQECFRALGYREGDFPEAEKASREVVSIPVYPYLPEDAREYVANTVREFFR